MVIAGGEATVYGMQSTVVLADGSNAGTFTPPLATPNSKTWTDGTS